MPDSIKTCDGNVWDTWRHTQWNVFSQIAETAYILGVSLVETAVILVLNIKVPDSIKTCDGNVWDTGRHTLCRFKYWMVHLNLA